MKRLTIFAAGLFFLLGAFTLAYAEDDAEKMDKDETCDIIGDCSSDMVKAAKSMLVECESMMAEADKIMKKGKMIRGQGLIWGDKDMENEGMAIYNQGKKMYDEAKALSDTCKIIIEDSEKREKKYKRGPDKKLDDNPARTGDHSPTN